MSTDCSAGIAQPCVCRFELSQRVRLSLRLLAFLGVIWSACASFALAQYTAPSTQVGQTSATLTATVTMTQAGTAATVAVVTKGAPNLDFKEVSDNCVTGASYSVGQFCTVNYTFNPLSAGERLGAVVVKDSSNHVLGTSYLEGLGVAPLGLFSAPTATWTVNGFSNPRGISVDGLGNVYLNDTGNQLLREIPAGGGTPASLVSVPSYDGGATAVDGAGNIYVSTNNGPNASSNGIYEPVNGSLGSPIATLPGDNTPDDNLAVDGAGNLYITDSHGGIYEIAAGTHARTTLFPSYGSNGVGGTLRFIGMAVDPSGNVFAVDYGGSSLYELKVGSSSLTLLARGYPLSGPHSIVLDPAGNIYVGNLGGGGIMRFAAGTYTETTLPADGTASLAIDGSGNLYAVNGNSVVLYSRTASPSESFPATVNGATSSASAPLVEFENDGNAGLVISSYGASSGFGVNGAGNTCATGTLAAGATCLIGASFSPEVAGPNIGTLTLTDNSLNQSGAQQTVNLAGTGLQGSQIIDFTQPASPVIAGSSDNLSATGGASGNPVLFSATGPATINGDSITYTGAGTVVVTANQAGNANYSAALSVSRTVTVNAAPTSYTAPAEPVQTASATQSATVTFTTAGTLGSISVVTQGASGKDFNVAPGGTCTVGMAYTAGQVCTVNYTFTPLSPGTREGAVVLKSTSGSVLGTSYLGGVGIGPLGLFTTATQTLSISGLNSVRGISLDGYGNLYGFDTAPGVVAKFAAGSTSETVLAYLPGSSAGGATAVDGAGNLFVMDTAAATLYEFVGASGPAITVASNIPASDDNLEVDGSGNLYYSGYGSSPTGAIYKVAAGTHQITTLIPGNLGHRFVAMAVDPAGNIFAPDFSNNILYELPAGSNTLVTLVSGGYLSNPHGIALDPAGNIYVANYNGSQVIRYAAGTHAPTLLPALGQRGIALDGAGNLYTITTDHTIAEFTRTQATPFTFPNTIVGTTSNSQNGVEFENDGNADLVITGYSATSPFALNGSQNTCAVGTLASGASCVVGATYSPLTVQNDSGTATITDNTLGVAGTAQTIGLSGRATQQTPVVSASSASINYSSTPTTLTASVSFIGSTVPTGAVTFSVDGGAAVAATCTGSSSPLSCTASYPTGSLSVPTHTIHASIASDTNFTSASSSATLTVNPIAPTISFTVANHTYGDAPFALAATSNSSGSFTYSLVSGPATVSGSTLTITGAGQVTVQASEAANGNYTAGTLNASFTVSQAQLGVAITGTPTKTYDATTAATLTPANFAVAGLVGSDSITINQSAGSYASANAGAESVTANLATANFIAVSGSLSNYILPPSATGAGLINQALASVTPNSATKVYGTVDPAFTGTLSGFVTADNVTASYTRAAGESVLGGPYAISATLAPSAVLSNYNITYNTALFRITAAPASVTPNPATKVYGAADPAFTGTLTGFVAADNVTATYTRAAGETVLGGPYAISATLAPAAVLSNYTITYNTALFTITPATAVINFGNVVQTYSSGPLAPTVTTVPAGLAYSMSGAPDIAAGSYPVTATVTNPNYVGSGSTSFTILHAPATIALSNLSQVYSGNPESATTTVSPAYCGPASVTYAGSAAPPSNIGTYPVVAIEANPNCTAPNATGTLIINAFAASSCVYSLNPNARSAFSVSDGSTVDAQCSIQVNSTSRDAFDVDGHKSTVQATAISVVGGASIDRSATVSNTPATGQTAVADPLATVIAPTVGTCNTATNHDWDGDDQHDAASKSITMNPGTYCGGIHIHGRSTVTFNPGTYILLGGGLNIDGGAQVTGTGVTFYNTGNHAHRYQPIHIDGGSKTTLSAPVSGSLAGVLFFQDRSIVQQGDADDHNGGNHGNEDHGQANTITGNTESSFTGALYFPSTPLVYSGGSEQDPAAYTLIVADTVSVAAHSNVSLTVLGKPMSDTDSDACSSGPGKDCHHDNDGDHNDQH